MKTNDEIEILDFLEQQINNLEEYDLLTRRGLVAKHFKEARQKILDLKDKWEREAKDELLNRLIDNRHAAYSVVITELTQEGK